MTFTAGHVAGWAWDTWSDKEAEDYSAEWNKGYKADPDGFLDFMKLDVTVAGGSSGSSVLNAAGEIVGVTVIVGASGKTVKTECRSLADTNNDGEVNDSDSCVPVGGFINGAVTIGDVRAFLAKQGVDLTP
jgi:S1-C subfamily serine protease